MQAQAGHGLKLGACPLHAHWHKALCGHKYRVGGGFSAKPPQQGLQLQACAAAGTTRRVAAVLGQQHADVHLVRLALQIFKKTLDAKPVLAPLAVPVGRAIDDPGLLIGRQLVPGRVARYACGFGVAHQIVLCFFPGWGLHDLDSAGAQRELVVRDHQAVVNPNHAAKAFAFFTRAHGRVERKE